MKLRIFTITILMGLLSGCVATWVQVTQPETVSPEKTFSAKLPEGWMQYLNDQDVILITRDGLALQTIALRRHDLKQAFGNIKKDAEIGMLAAELAELYIANAMQSDSTENITVVENRPATISEQSSFRLHLTYTNTKGLGFERIVYGFVTEKGFFTLAYEAPTRYHFERYLGHFESIVASFREV